MSIITKATLVVVCGTIGAAALSVLPTVFSFIDAVLFSPTTGLLLFGVFGGLLAMKANEEVSDYYVNMSMYDLEEQAGLTKSQSQLSALIILFGVIGTFVGHTLMMAKPESPFTFTGGWILLSLVCYLGSAIAGCWLLKNWLEDYFHVKRLLAQEAG